MVAVLYLQSQVCILGLTSVTRVEEMDCPLNATGLVGKFVI
jgi:hypothetical protein